MFLRTVFYFQPVYLTIFFIIHLLQVNVYFSLSDYIIKDKNTSWNITVRRTTKKAEGKIRQKAVSFEIAFCTRSIKVTIYCMGNMSGIRKMVIMASIIAKGVPHFK